jgi:hypothetical protein
MEREQLRRLLFGDNLAHARARILLIRRHARLVRRVGWACGAASLGFLVLAVLLQGVGITLPLFTLAAALLFVGACALWFTVLAGLIARLIFDD